MNKHSLTFKVIELGSSASPRDIRLPSTETVEVLDITTRILARVKAKDVSMYRHTLRMQGKNFNIVNIWNSM